MQVTNNVINLPGHHPLGERNKTVLLFTTSPSQKVDWFSHDYGLNYRKR